MPEIHHQALGMGNRSVGEGVISKSRMVGLEMHILFVRYAEDVCYKQRLDTLLAAFQHNERVLTVRDVGVFCFAEDYSQLGLVFKI